MVRPLYNLKLSGGRIASFGAGESRVMPCNPARIALGQRALIGEWMMTKIVRDFTHRTYGAIGSVELVAPDGEWVLTPKGQDAKTLPATSVAHLVNFALQTLQDSYAGSKTADEAQGSFGKKLDALIAGTLGQRTGGGVGLVQVKARQFARQAAKLAWSADKYKERLGVGLDASAINAVLDGIVEKNPKLIEMAKAKIAEEAAAREAAAKFADTMDMDVGDLLGDSE